MFDPLDLSTVSTLNPTRSICQVFSYWSLPSTQFSVLRLKSLTRTLQPFNFKTLFPLPKNYTCKLIKYKKKSGSRSSGIGCYRRSGGYSSAVGEEPFGPLSRLHGVNHQRLRRHRKIALPQTHSTTSSISVLSTFHEQLDIRDDDWCHLRYFRSVYLHLS